MSYQQVKFHTSLSSYSLNPLFYRAVNQARPSHRFVDEAATSHINRHRSVIISAVHYLNTSYSRRRYEWLQQYAKLSDDRGRGPWGGGGGGLSGECARERRSPRPKKQNYFATFPQVGRSSARWRAEWAASGLADNFDAKQRVLSCRTVRGAEASARLFCPYLTEWPRYAYQVPNVALLTRSSIRKLRTRWDLLDKSLWRD